MMKALTRARYSLPFLIVVAAFNGCGTDDGRFEVAGRVTLDGKPVSKAMVAFSPASGASSSGAVAMVVDGRFEIAETAGLRAGEYAVRVADIKPELEEFEENRFAGKLPMSSPVIPAKYSTTDALRVKIDGSDLDMLIELKK